MKAEEFIKKHGRQGTEPWIHYCEAMVDQNGEVYEAVPSHQEFLIKTAMKKFGLTRRELYEQIPPEYSPLHLLAELLGFVPIWYRFGLASPHDEGRTGQTIEALKGAGLLAASFGLMPNREFQIYKERNGL